jgi:hypothetical protein
MDLHRYYCGTPGLSEPTSECDAGWYCTGAAQEAQPASVTGGRCVVGYYCPRGSSMQTDCTPGMYCDSPGLAEPTGNCSAGYYCLAASGTATPTDGVQGVNPKSCMYFRKRDCNMWSRH